mmetsp:Transcript_10649/g.23527  ORF Transcript_10649/g.23527 Transcript_10649/m.23527 type:complete len:282 (+) Transcript_10649:578-1423(+)
MEDSVPLSVVFGRGLFQFSICSLHLGIVLILVVLCSQDMSTYGIALYSIEPIKRNLIRLDCFLTIMRFIVNEFLEVFKRLAIFLLGKKLYVMQGIGEGFRLCCAFNLCEFIGKRTVFGKNHINENGEFHRIDRILRVRESPRWLVGSLNGQVFQVRLNTLHCTMFNSVAGNLHNGVMIQWLFPRRGRTLDRTLKGCRWGRAVNVSTPFTRGSALVVMTPLGTSRITTCGAPSWAQLSDRSPAAGMFSNKLTFAGSSNSSTFSVNSGVVVVEEVGVREAVLD